MLFRVAGGGSERRGVGGYTNRLCIWLALVVRHSWVCHLVWLMYLCRCGCRAAVREVRRTLRALRLERWSHTTTHVLVWDGAVGLGRLIRHVGVELLLLRLEPTTTAAVWWVTTVDVCVVQVAVARLRGLTAQVLSWSV
jgi:hypothetical protein